MFDPTVKLDTVELDRARLAHERAKLLRPNVVIPATQVLSKSQIPIDLAAALEQRGRVKPWQRFLHRVKRTLYSLVPSR